MCKLLQTPLLTSILRVSIKVMSLKDQCWACHKGRLVCDGTLPACKKCAKRGTICPGYAPVKPLTWVEPGVARSKRKGTKRSSNNHSSRSDSDDQQKRKDDNTHEVQLSDSSASTPPAATAKAKAKATKGELVLLPQGRLRELPTSMAIPVDAKAVISAVEYCKPFPLNSSYPSASIGAYDIWDGRTNQGRNKPI